jgi:S1-C subfamily serine protease
MKTKYSLVAVVVITMALLSCQAPAFPSIQPSVAIQPVESIQPVQPAVAAVQNPAAQGDTLVALFDRVSPGTVAIITENGQGSGFVYDAQGNIVTNYHVIDGAKTVEVRFTSGFMAYGTVVGTDLDSDLAIVKVDAPAGELHPLPLGDSSILKVGQTVVAIGNPFGLNSTMTVGIISALGRTLASVHESPDGSLFTAGDIIQTDAAINPGNSGGPLFNINGEVIGVNRAIISTNFTNSGQPINSGVGFAVSINMIKRVTPVLISTGKYDYPYLGVTSMHSLTLDMVDALGLKSFTGAYITQVIPGGPADQAGIKAGDTRTNIPGLLGGGDMVVAVDAHPIRTFDDLLSYLINNKSPGDTVVLTVLRGDQNVDINVTLAKRP